MCIGNAYKLWCLEHNAKPGLLDFREQLLTQIAAPTPAHTLMYSRQPHQLYTSPSSAIGPSCILTAATASIAPGGEDSGAGRITSARCVTCICMLRPALGPTMTSIT